VSGFFVDVAEGVSSSLHWEGWFLQYLFRKSAKFKTGQILYMILLSIRLDRSSSRAMI
jgi:hypothetical protein